MHRQRQRIGRPWRKRRAHRRVGEQQLPVWVEDGHRVLERILARPEQRLCRRGPVRRQPCADGVEEIAELTELVALRQIHDHPKLALSQSGEAATDDVNGTEQQLRQEHRHEARADQDHEGGQNGRPQRLIEIALDEQRRDADVNRAELGGAHEQRLPDFERPSAVGVDGAELRYRAALEERVEVAVRRKRLTDARRVAVRDRDAGHVDDRRVGHIARIRARLEDRAQAAIFTKGDARIAAGLHGFAGALVNRVGEQLAARLALFEPDARQRRQVEAAQDDDREPHDRRDAGDLLRLDAQPHGIRARRPVS